MSYDKKYEKEMSALFDMMDESMLLMEERMKHLRKRKFTKNTELSGALKQLLKEELVEIAREYNILNSEKFKKADLIDTVCEQIFEELPSRMTAMNTKHFEVLDLIMEGTFDDDELYIESVGLLEEWGYVFSFAEEEELKAFVPKDIYDFVKDFYIRGNVKETAQMNRDIVDYLDTATAYYGAVSFEVIGEQFLKLFGVDMDYEMLYQVMIMNASFSRHTEYDDMGDFFCNSYTEDPEELLDVVSDIPPENYKMMTRHIIDDFVKYERIRCDASIEFGQMIVEKARLDEEEADLMVEEMEESIRHAVPLEEHYKVLDEVFDFLEETDLEQLKVAFEAMFKDIPFWVYKGYSINEMNGKKKRHLKLV